MIRLSPGNRIFGKMPVDEIAPDCRIIAMFSLC